MLIVDINPDGTTHETVIPDPEPTPEETARAALLARLGITEDEARLLLGQP